MKRSLFLAIVALISAIFGIGLLLKPFELMAMYQVNVCSWPDCSVPL